MANKISIIVPIYNTEKYLKKCIESIINQKYKNLEIILINDGSNEDSYLIGNCFFLYLQIDLLFFYSKKNNNFLYFLYFD